MRETRDRGLAGALRALGEARARSSVLGEHPTLVSGGFSYNLRVSGANPAIGRWNGEGLPPERAAAVGQWTGAGTRLDRSSTLAAPSRSWSPAPSFSCEE